MLLAADLVVTPTVAPAYPCGQSVLLEAMSIGAATLTTDSLAIREYVTDGTDGALVLPRDPDALAARIAALMADSAEREAMGTAAARTVRARFGLEHLWGAGPSKWPRYSRNADGQAIQAYRAPVYPRVVFLALRKSRIPRSVG